MGDTKSTRVLVVSILVRCRSDLSASAVLYAHDRYCRGLGRVLVLIIHAPPAGQTAVKQTKDTVVKQTAVKQTTDTEANTCQADRPLRTYGPTGARGRLWFSSVYSTR